MHNNSNSFQNTSYNIHENHFNQFDEERNAINNSWFNSDTVDYWRHNRMYEPLRPILNSYPNTKWLTIGDGRFGLDSIKLKKMEPSLDILPTDISPYLLKLAKEKNLIKEYKIENAECLTFKDNEFDFTFCKESFHHFPRPFLALYEMLRVSKKGVILIEPNDQNIIQPSTMFHLSLIQKWATRVIKNKIKLLLGKEIYYNYGGYEPVGNYVYSISEREIEKVALGLNLPVIAFKGLNDYYIKGVEFEKATNDSELFSKIKSAINSMDTRSKKITANYGILIAIIFKDNIGNDLLEELKKSDFFIKFLPRNPYVK